jgi:5-methylcytosine-specific restriction endonuclease McrA
MFAYCVHELRMSEDVACKRIRVGRLARRFPVILPALADGRLHVSGVFLLSKHLTEGTAAELLAAAMDKTKSQIELLLAQRFPQADVPTRLEPVPAHSPGSSAAAATPTSAAGSAPSDAAPAPPALGLAAPVAGPPVPGRVDRPLPPEPRPRVAPLAPQRFALQVTLDQETHDLLRQAQDLLGHAVPAGDLAEVLKRALRSLVSGLERTRFAATSRPRPARRSGSEDPRHIPTAVRRAVRARDGGQCTFMGEGGRRCPERRGLQFDHVEPVARGGEATVHGIRLLCPTHNQHEAERVFGAGFMEAKREAARFTQARRRAARVPPTALAPAPRAAASPAPRE